ncbi:MAG: transporter substrate-binding domain-containing protein, partial [Deltaproteobacteria bacterium]|nr:transporter substrate-binding domain-containing protein [Deltaproteobacteria bacterium]
MSVALAVALLFSEILTSAVCMATAAEPPIRVGSEVDFPPFAALDARGKATGFSVDLIRAVADAAGLRV